MQAALILDLRERAEPSRATLCCVPEVDDVVARARRGDEAAFRQLFVKHRGDVARLVFRMMGTSTDLEDVVQEVFLHVHRSLRYFRGRSKFTTWLHRVTVNVVLMQRRTARSRPNLVGLEPQDVQPDGRAAPDDDVARLERVRAFRRLLARLTDKKRTVFILHELEGVSPAEIAKIVGVPVLTVRTRLFYARRELSRLLRDEPALESFAQELEGGGAIQEVALARGPLEETR